MFERCRQKDAEYAGVYNNYATPLMGTVLNLTEEPIQVTCPSCNAKALSEVHVEMKKWSKIFNWCLCIFYTGCCCFLCCQSPGSIFVRNDINHYCQNCHCYFGRAKRIAPYTPTTRA